jgi:two-component system, sensor histidine kinase FlrB
MSNTANLMQQPVHEIKDQQTLMAAFQQFSHLSEQLQTSYQALDSRTEELTRELAITRDDRLKQLDEKEKLADRLEKLLAALPAGVIVVNTKGIVQTANAAAEIIFDQSLEGKKWQHVLSISVQRTEAQDIILKNANVISMTSQTLEADEGEIILINDVSHNRMLQNLADRQNRLAAMGQMAAGLAHQLRTPLSSAMLYASQIDKVNINPQQQGRAVEKIRTSLRYLEKLINDMLMYAKGGEFSDSSFSLNQLLVLFYSRIETQLQPTGSTLKINNHMPKISLQGSLDALVSVLTNLAENALQACEENCTIELDVYQQADFVILAMKDNGPGLTQEQQLHIFEPFYSERDSGTGLGLAVAQSIAQAHQGDLMVKSEADKGCTFYLCLPLNQGEQFLPSGRSNIAGQHDGETK